MAQNPRLQCAWDKYGEDNFSFEIDTVCSRENLYKIEKEAYEDYVYILGRSNVYNVYPPGVNHMLGKKMSSETKRKISEANKGKLAGTRHPMYGKKHSRETRDKISKAVRGELHPFYGKMGKNSSNRGELVGSNNPMYGKRGEDCPNSKLTQQEADDIRDMFSTGMYSHNDLGKIFGVSGLTVSRIIRGVKYNGR